MYFLIFKFAFQNWHTIELPELHEQVTQNKITGAQFTEITGQPFEEASVNENPTSAQ